MNGQAFRELAHTLAGEFEVRVPDFPGYGGTPPCEPHTLEQLANRVAREAPACCTVAGWSLGAQVALSWARAQPAQVGRLALLGATPCFTAREDWRWGLAPDLLETFSQLVAQNVQSALERFVSLQVQGDEAAREVARALRASLAAAPLPELRALQQGLTLLRGTDLRSHLQEIAQPTLVIHGDQDQLVPVDAGRYIARELPSASFRAIAGAAHAPFLSKPQAVARLFAEHFR
jgi:pimeloyl-[acyl-carrier protein] methyl ester esterase